MQFLRSLLKTSPQLAKSYALPKRNMSMIAVPPREKVSKAELIFLSTIMVIGWTAIPAWVLVNIKHYRASADE